MPLPDSPPTSPGLLRLLSGEPNDAAWRRFLARYEAVIAGWCRAAALQPADADDLRQTIVEGLLKGLRGFRYDPAQRFRGYLRACVNNAVRKHFRERGRKPGNFGTGGDGPGLLDAVPAADPDGLAAALDDSLSGDLRGLSRVVEQVRSQVSADTWQAYLLTAIEGRPAADAARELGKSVAAVYMAKSRVGKLLREAGRADHEEGTIPPT